MKAQKLNSTDKDEKIGSVYLNILFRAVFPYMSNVVVFNLAYFCLGGSTTADSEFRGALIQELFRRGLLRSPYIDEPYNVNVDEFTEEEVDSINSLFACDQEKPTPEDTYVELFTDRDRWTERNTSKRKRRAAKKTRTRGPAIDEDDFEDEDDEL
jgi:hypothetical protein